MSLEWDAGETQGIENAIQEHPVDSGRCAALARRVYMIARPSDPHAHGFQVRAKKPARFVVPKLDSPPRWSSHTLVGTRGHAVDALTGAPGCPLDGYLAQHWEYPDQLITEGVDPFSVDPGIQDDHG